MRRETGAAVRGAEEGGAHEAGSGLRIDSNAVGRGLHSADHRELMPLGDHVARQPLHDEADSSEIFVVRAVDGEPHRAAHST